AEVFRPRPRSCPRWGQGRRVAAAARSHRGGTRRSGIPRHRVHARIRLPGRSRWRIAPPWRRASAPRENGRAHGQKSSRRKTAPRAGSTGRRPAGFGGNRRSSGSGKFPQGRAGNPPDPGVRVEDSGEGGGFKVFHGLQSLIDDARNRKKGDLPGEKGADRTLVGGVENRRRDAAGGHDLAGEPETGKAQLVYRAELEAEQL